MLEFLLPIIQISYFGGGIRMAIDSEPMKLKFFATVGILSFALSMQAQYADTSTNAQKNIALGMSSEYSVNDYANRLGIGVQFGEPLGLNAKYWLNDTFAVDGAVGWSPQEYSSAEIHADFLVHDFDLITPSSGKMPVYIGGGLFGRFRNQGRDDLTGLRFPIGVSYMFDSCPLDIFGEVAPQLIFAPFLRGGITADVGFRLWF
jgi:hypothetical protein